MNINGSARRAKYQNYITKVNDERRKMRQKLWGQHQHQPVQTKQNKTANKPFDVRPEINCFTKKHCFNYGRVESN